VELGNPNNVIQATRFVVIDNFLIDALFSFGTANAGKRFLIFVSGPNGTSRNLTELPAGAPAGCPLGNEQGIQVTFTCNVVRPNCNINSPVDQNCPCGSVGSPDPRAACAPISPPVVNACDLKRNAGGAFLLDILGGNFKQGVTVTLTKQGNDVTPKRIRLKDPAGNGTFNRLELKGRVCQGIPGAITVRNSDGGVSAVFQCNEICPNQ
jgi:hypothetical protein